MPSKKTAKLSLFQAVNVIVAVLLLAAFFITGQTVTETYVVADITSLANLMPEPMDYLWDLNINQAPLDRNKIRYYADYFEHLIKVIPGTRDAYGVLGYCYHYLGDDVKAIAFLKLAVVNNPHYAWNYYNLAAIYFNERRYQEATSTFEQLQMVDPNDTLNRMFNSDWVYFPLIKVGGKSAIALTTQHLKVYYRGAIVATQLLKQRGSNPKIDEVLSKTKMELYAF